MVFRDSIYISYQFRTVSMLWYVPYMVLVFQNNTFNIFQRMNLFCVWFNDYDGIDADLNMVNFKFLILTFNSFKQCRNLWCLTVRPKGYHQHFPVIFLFKNIFLTLWLLVLIWLCFRSFQVWTAFSRLYYVIDIKM